MGVIVGAVGAAMTGTTIVSEIGGQPSLLVAVMRRVTVGPVPAVHVMLGVAAPLVMVPPVMLQEYDTPC